MKKPTHSSKINPHILIFLIFSILCISVHGETKPLRMAIAGLEHGHAGGFFRRWDPAEVEIVGVAEPDANVAAKYFEKYNLDPKLNYRDLEEMIEATKPEAVAAFTSTKGHREVVEICAPRGIHVMVEKPLAVNYDDARVMAKLARKHGIHLLTNYETTWYSTTQEILKMEAKEALGPTRKIVVHDGHRGPAEINVPPEFLDWLTDPVRNGGGAIMDFGCYGVNIMTAMMENRLPDSVTAVTQTIKPEIYKEVDDESTIILTYPTAHGIIQGSWNWPISRKDVELYGKTGALRTVDQTKMFVQIDRSKPLKDIQLEPNLEPMNDPYLYFAAVVRGKIDPTGKLSSLENALVTMKILDAARESAGTGKTVILSPEN